MNLRCGVHMRLVSVLFAAACTVGCTRGSDSKLGPEEFQALTAPYPKGGWRLAQHELHKAALTFSHLLIRHDGSVSDTANFRAPEWNPDEPSVRSKSEAQYLAARLSKRLQEEPAAFQRLVDAYSDDIVTRPFGGSFGTWSASLIPPPLLDALERMKPGEISRVVESDFGFHILLLRETSPVQNVTARRIVISYKNTSPTLMREGRMPTRTRGEALAIARVVSQRGKTNPSQFSDLVEEYSDNADSLRGGDIGTWSTHAGHMKSREIEVIAALSVGEVSEPVDTPDGFCVFIRDAYVERSELAWQQLDVSMLLARESKPGASALSMRDYARSLSAEVREHPARFDSLRAQACCGVTSQASFGKGVPQVENALRDTPVGEFARDPVWTSETDVRIVRRVAAEPIAAEGPIATRLPSRAEPDIAYLVRSAESGAALAAYIHSVHESMGTGAGLALTEGDAKKLDEIIVDLESKLRDAPADVRLSLIAATRQRIRLELGSGVEEPYYTRFAGEIIRQLL